MRGSPQVALNSHSDPRIWRGIQPGGYAQCHVSRDPGFAVESFSWCAPTTDNPSNRPAQLNSPPSRTMRLNTGFAALLEERFEARVLKRSRQYAYCKALIVIFPSAAKARRD
jgi:hypothetical protein